MHNNETLKISIDFDREQEVRKIISHVYKALTEKGYDPMCQLVGYIMSGDPTYITSHDGARSSIVKVERDELLEVLIKNYINSL